MAKAESFNVVNNREDKTDLYTIVSPEETPMLSGLPKFRAQTATLIEWTADDYENVSFAGTIEGTDQTTHKDKTENRVLLSNRYQEERRPYAVSNIQNKVDVAGVSDEVSFAQSKAMVELKRDLESALGSNEEVQLGSGAQASKLRGLGKWIDSSNTNIDSSVRTPSASEGTTSTLSESSFNDVLQSVFEQSGSVMDMRLYAGPTLQRKISDFTRAEGNTTPTPFIVNSDQSSREIVFSVQFYRGDFANVQIISDLFLGRTSGSGLTTASKQTGYLVDPDKVHCSVWEDMNIVEQTDNGGGPRGFARGILTSIVKNPKGLGMFSG